ncbi:MAG: NAD(P)/FAD-dependent oxidoreductase [Clostridiaceae bacterium]|nr:NAD(P)/FAD-dependent oxidoreductase [Clostridiaceae bacterium]
MNLFSQNPYDIVIIGAGVVGNAIARELSRYKLKIAVLEKEPDLCLGTSGRNSGVLHAGFNSRPGTLMARFCVAGCLGFDQTAQELAIPFNRTGKVVVGFDDQDRQSLLALKAQGEANGVPGLAMIGKSKLAELAPHIRGEFALFSPMTGIVNPFIYTVALAENACQNGVTFFFNQEVTGIRRSESQYEIQTGAGRFAARWVINCAGLQADTIARLFGVADYSVFPCRGEYYLLDKQVGAFLPMPAYPVPNIREGGLGVHLTPTTDGTVLIGPSTEYIDERDDYATTRGTLDLLLRDGSRIFPCLRPEYVIRNFSGIRPKLVGRDQGGYGDFVIDTRRELPHVIQLIGIESPGLTSAVPIARHIAGMIGERQDLVENEDFNPTRPGLVSFAGQSDQKKQALINGNPDYGEIICRCEQISKAEILAAIRGPLGARTLHGIKARTHAMMGRCQGGYCQTRLAEILQTELNLRDDEVLLSRGGSALFTGKVREI